MISLDLPLKEYDLRGVTIYYVQREAWVQVSRAAGQGQAAIPWRPWAVGIDQEPISEEGWWR